GDPFGHVRGPRLNSFMTILRANQDIIGVLIFGAVFERHPRLRVVCVEADAGWAPHWMYRADHAYDRHRNWLTAGELSQTPSERFVALVRADFAGVRAGFFALLISSGADLVTGLALASITNTLKALPGLIILIPAAIGMRGNIFGGLGSRLGTQIHAGTFRVS